MRVDSVETSTAVATRTLITSDLVVCAELDGEAVLLNVETGIYFGLDAIAAHIWRLLSEGATQESIAERLTEEYDAEPSELRADLDAFLDQLAERGLIRALDA